MAPAPSLAACLIVLSACVGVVDVLSFWFCFFSQRHIVFFSLVGQALDTAAAPETTPEDAAAALEAAKADFSSALERGNLAADASSGEQMTAAASYAGLGACCSLHVCVYVYVCLCLCVCACVVLLFVRGSKPGSLTFMVIHAVRVALAEKDDATASALVDALRSAYVHVVVCGVCICGVCVCPYERTAVRSNRRAP